MWITKVIFKGSEGNATTTIDESTDERYAQMKYSREIGKWLKIICEMEVPNHAVMYTNNKTNNNESIISLGIIQLFIDAINKKNNNTNMSFEISMYEDN